MYIANHAYAIQGLPIEEGQKEIKELIDYASQPKYVVPIHWNDPGDLGKSSYWTSCDGSGVQN